MGGRASLEQSPSFLGSWAPGQSERKQLVPFPGPSLAPGLGLFWPRASVFGCDSFPWVGVLFHRLPAKPSPWPSSRGLGHSRAGLERGTEGGPSGGRWHDQPLTRPSRKCS